MTERRILSRLTGMGSPSAVIAFWCGISDCVPGKYGHTHPHSSGSRSGGAGEGEWREGRRRKRRSNELGSSSLAYNDEMGRIPVGPFHPPLRTLHGPTSLCALGECSNGLRIVSRTRRMRCVAANIFCCRCRAYTHPRPTIIGTIRLKWWTHLSCGACQQLYS